MMAAFLPFMFTSCLGDLDTKPLDETIFTGDKAFQNEIGYTQGLAKLYAALGMSGQDGAGSSEIANTDAGTSALPPMNANGRRQGIQVLLNWTITPTGQ